MTPLPPGFLSRPLAHRGLHGPGRPENSVAAVMAAAAAGFGAEIDLQISADGQAMVFHDEDLGRLTDHTGPVAAREAADLRGIRLSDTEETIPTLPALLNRLAGRAPLLIEIKDQDGALGPDIGALEEATARALHGYRGPVAVMSFNPHSVAAMKTLLPRCARGLVTCAFTAEDWPDVPETRRANLTRLSMLDGAEAAFVSHDVDDLASPHLAPLRARGLPILCWTVRSAAVAAQALRRADQITFEGFIPDAPAA